MSPCGPIALSTPSADADELLFPLPDELRRAGIVAGPAAHAAPAGMKSSLGTAPSPALGGQGSSVTLRTDPTSARDGHAALEAWLRRTAPSDETDEA